MEIWLPIQWAPAYEVSNLGRVFSLRRKHLLNPGNVLGYRQVRLHGISIYVHQLVAAEFLDPGLPDQDEINHKNGDKSDCRADNLEWSTGIGNVRHSMNVLGSHRGERNVNAKLTEADVLRIRQLIKMGLTNAQIAEQFDVQQSTIWYIEKGKTWGHV